MVFISDFTSVDEEFDGYCMIGIMEFGGITV